jgi:hypothetical protein
LKFRLLGMGICLAAAATVTPASAACSYPQVGCATSDAIEDLAYVTNEQYELARLVPVLSVNDLSQDAATMMQEYNRTCYITLYKKVRPYGSGYHTDFTTTTICVDGSNKPRGIQRMEGQSYLQSAGDGHVVSAGNRYDTSNYGKSSNWHVTDKRYVYYVQAYASLYAPYGYTWEGSQSGCYGRGTRILRCSLKSTNFK